MTPELENIVVHFGEMGSRWGFNRTVGQMLALIVLSDRPLAADEIAAELKVSRGNVSMAAKELHAWHLVRTHREPGDRKDYLVAAGNIWELAQQVLTERKKREMDPTLSLLRSQLLDGNEDDPPTHARQQLQEMHDLLELLNRGFDEVQTLTPDQLKRLLTLGTGVLKFTDRIRPGGRKD
ncbi:GbsR/MarR family transcriptional regulator [Saccharospirillum sp. MSK14-1]|uniref:GbsR/MarR family transcriptional regulator n=1 Tax=Saccharospirillum sp. MSK14-1 TaxID=1897632 RepID=UPI001E5A3138|nr:MarR family transcriptional regulator [Saccharospirillum sp. MSK14-1]